MGGIATFIVATKTQAEYALGVLVAEAAGAVGET